MVVVADMLPSHTQVNSSSCRKCYGPIRGMAEVILVRIAKLKFRRGSRDGLTCKLVLLYGQERPPQTIALLQEARENARRSEFNEEQCAVNFRRRDR